MTLVAERPAPNPTRHPVPPRPQPPNRRPYPATAVRPRVTLAYRALLTARGHQALDAVRSATAAWVTGKYRACPSASGHHALTDTATLTSQAVYGPDGRESAIRLQLREQKPEATWRTTVTAVETGPLVHAAVSLEVFTNPGHHVTPAWPALIKVLAKAMAPIDGPARLTGAAQSIGKFDVPFLLDILRSPERTKPAILAARPLSAVRLWSERMGKVMPACAGAASLYLLEDPAAVDAFRQAVGYHHRVAPGTVRTYNPRVDIENPHDGPRHHYIPGIRLSDPEDRVWRAIAATVQRASTAAALPPALTDLVFPEIGAAHREARHAALAALRPSLELAAAQRDVEELTQLLQVADADLREAEAGATLSAATITALETQVDEALERADASDEDTLWALTEAERARAEAEILRARLLGEGRYEDAAVEVEHVHAPSNFEEIWARAGELTGVSLTADAATAFGLEEHERHPVWAGKAWQGLRALDGYATCARAGFAGSFYDYCRRGATGTAGWSANQVTLFESETTMGQWGHERIFPVPPEVAPEGHAVMQAHLRIDSRGMISPRVYFLDDTKGATGTVIVGYIGPHLTTTQTN